MGSDNLDERSMHLNSETAFFIDSGEIGLKLTQAFEALVGQSYLFGEADWLTMREQKQVKERELLMKAFGELYKLVPEAAAFN